MVWFYNMPGKDPEKNTAEGNMNITLHCQPQPREDMASPSFCCTLWLGVGSAAGEGKKFELHECCICVKIVIC